MYMRWTARVRWTFVVVCLLVSVLGVGTSAGAAITTPPSAAQMQGAINWAKARLGQHIYDGDCLSFVHDAYSGAGYEIGFAPTAVAYWRNNPAWQHPGDLSPPPGALVFWNATAANSAGHVGLSLGNGYVISSYEQADHNIHIFSISARNAAKYPYLGWLNVGGQRPSPPGDITGDGQVTIVDLSILLSNYGKATPRGDLNHDGVVNIFDLSILLTHYGQ